MSAFPPFLFLAILLTAGLLPLQAAESFSGDRPNAPIGAEISEDIPVKQGMASVSLKSTESGNPSARRVSGRGRLPKQKKASELIHRQDPPLVVPRVLYQAMPQNVSIFISLLRQRIYLKVGEEVAVDAPLSSGKAEGMTPKGQFTILEKDPDHRSSVYGNFVNAQGKVVRAGVSLKIDSAPSGTTYVGAPMRWFMRLTWQGIGMHAGILPGYPASHGCIRLPEQIAKIIYDRIRIGTRVIVAD